jgi:hypothetical protein
MTTDIKHIKVDRNTRIEPILEAAGNSPVILEFGDAAYRLNPVGETSSPFTAETAYGSVRTVDGRGGEDISAEEPDALIEDAGRRYAQRQVEEIDRDG